MENYILDFKEIDADDLQRVGGENVTLSKRMQGTQKDEIQVSDGFAVTAKAYEEFLSFNHIEGGIKALLIQLDRQGYSNLPWVGKHIRQLILESDLPYTVQIAVLAAYDELKERAGGNGAVAVRSSLVTGDASTSSSNWEQEEYLNIKDENQLLNCCRLCYAALFNNRNIKYREDHGVDHMKVGLSIGVQLMVCGALISDGH